MFSTRELLILSKVDGLGDVKLRQLLSQFSSLDELFETPFARLEKITSPSLAKSFLDFRKNSQYEKAIQFSEEQISKAEKLNGKIISITESDYPEILKTIYDAPIFLFVLGTLEPNDKYSLAIVGTRNPTNYGKQVCENFTKEFSRLGITIISGLAYGIDTIAHKTALANGTRTIAVLAGGVDKIYPQENVELAKEIAEHGAVISEFPFGTTPEAFNFPRRNRIISGLSLGTLLIESKIGGGGMITASIALDQNREVFCIPGLVTEKKSEGCNVLIKEGRAKLAQTPDDVLKELEYKLRPILKPSSQKPVQEVSLTLFEKKIFDSLSTEPTHIDIIAEKTELTTSDVLVNLLSLEFKNVVKQLAGKMFVKTL
ncbi:MAG: DNA-processing protein DprA [Ignavibacteriales bacterium]|nr:DNA-processing protein DprA [Ignavibacteriales bacterium]